MSEEQERLRAAALGQTEWGSWGSSREHRRYAVQTDSRRRCSCNCGGRANWSGMANGLAMMDGCEMRVRRWVRDPEDIIAAPCPSRHLHVTGKGHPFPTERCTCGRRRAVLA